MKLSVRYLLQAVSTPFSVLLLNLTCVQIMSTSPRSVYKLNYNQDGHNGNVYIFFPPCHEEDSRYIYRLFKSLHGMPSVARAWLTTMSTFLNREGCETVSFEKIQRAVINCHRILHVLGAHIDDFVIACANRGVLNAFQKRLLEAFECTYEGPLEHYLGCEIGRDTVAITTTLSQEHYAEEILRSYGYVDIPTRRTPMKDNTCLSKDDSDPNPKSDFHRRYRGIVGSLHALRVCLCVYVHVLHIHIYITYLSL